MASHIERRKFLTTLGGAAAWPLAARAQQAAVPIVGLVSIRSADASARHAAAFRKGLNETGMVEGQDVMVEYHWLDGHYDRPPAGRDCCGGSFGRLGTSAEARCRDRGHAASNY
jgi:putative ABC transport system substrate-binding protein